MVILRGRREQGRGVGAIEGTGCGMIRGEKGASQGTLSAANYWGRGVWGAEGKVGRAAEELHYRRLIACMAPLCTRVHAETAGFGGDRR